MWKRGGDKRKRRKHNLSDVDEKRRVKERGENII